MFINIFSFSYFLFFYSYEIINIIRYNNINFLIYYLFTRKIIKNLIFIEFMYFCFFKKKYFKKMNIYKIIRTYFI